MLVHIRSTHGDLRLTLSNADEVLDSQVGGDTPGGKPGCDHDDRVPRRVRRRRHLDVPARR